MLKNIISAALAAAVCMSFVSCGKGKKADDKGTAATTAADNSSTAAPTAYAEPVTAAADGSEVIGELVTPAETDDDYTLGSFYLASTGVKLYFDPDTIPEQLMFTLEKYFTAYSNKDYASYTETVYPSYLENMNTYTMDEMGYSLEDSFNSKCDNLSDNMGGEFTVTRIKAGYTQEDIDKMEAEGTTQTPEDELTEEFFANINDWFGKDYYSEVKAEADKIYYFPFYVVAMDSSGCETALIQDFDIVFAEKDGRYYAFG